MYRLWSMTHPRVCGPGCTRVPVRLHVSLALFLGVSVLGEFSHLDVPRLILTATYASLGIALPRLTKPVLT